MSATGTQHHNETRIVADPALPTIVITREFDAPPERVFRAYTDPDLVVRWLGLGGSRCGSSGTTRAAAAPIATCIARTTGPSTASTACSTRCAPTSASCRRSPSRLPRRRQLETAVFEDLGGRTRVTTTSLMGSIEDRDAMISSGMEGGLREGYERLDELLDGGRSDSADRHTDREMTS